MITEAEIRKAAELKGVQVKEHESGPWPYKNSRMIGVEWSPFVFYWFRVENIRGKTFVDFHEVFSMRTGFSHRGIRRGIDVETRLARYLVKRGYPVEDPILAE